MVDVLRPPPLLDPSAAAYKDWLHLNLFDPTSGAIGICNASLHGAPSDPRSLVIGAALVHLADLGWVGNVEVAGFREARIGTASIALERVAIGTDGDARVLASALLPLDGLHLAVTARARTPPIDIEYPTPFGEGWIAWYVLPRLEVRGTLIAAGRRLELEHATAYHDHNWGRWHWGDDVGWEWGACAATGTTATLVLSRATDRSHRIATGALLHVEIAGERRVFGAPSLRIHLSGRLATPPRRVPGALAALHQDRVAPPLPGRIVVDADDGIDGAEIEFTPRAALQLIAADPARRGYGFIHEMVGGFTARCRIGGRAYDLHGLAVFEYVD
ncbi:MAG: hypothetical protein ACREMX_15195 [Gemmatimonadales bacterium]